MKYEQPLLEAGTLLSNAKNILIALPAEAGIDELASGLALYLSLEQAGKKPVIVTEGVIRVGHAHLFGIGQVQNKLPQMTGGNFILSLGGVVTQDANGQGVVPSLEKLDWFPQGNDLNLVFHVIPGQKFEPTHVTPKFEGGNFEVIFTLGAASLEKLGSIYQNSQQVFTSVPIINLDIKQDNADYGKINIVDPASSSLSEIMAESLPALHLPFETDIATNILTGIFAATNNLQKGNLGADTFTVVASALRVGGQKPAWAATVTNSASGTGSVNLPWVNPPQSQSIPGANPAAVNSQADNFTVPPVVSDSQPQGPQVMAEEMPSGEAAKTSPEADWLTPKIFKGSGRG